MKAEAYFGVDLGTSQCSVAYIVDSPRLRDQKVVDPQLVKLSSGLTAGVSAETFPSLVGMDWTDKRRVHPLFGARFLQTFAARKLAPLLRRGRDFFTSVKSDMGTNRVCPFSRVPGMQTPTQVTAALLKHLVEQTREVNPDLNLAASRVVITVPASFSALAREDTLKAANAAGFEAVQLLDEPVAALLDCLNHQDAGVFLSDRFQDVLVFDYGGGTCDLALMRAKLSTHNPLGMQIETLAISPYTKLGGDDVDRAIVERVLLRDAGLDDLKGTPAWKSLVETLSISVARRLKEDLCHQIAATTTLRERKRLRASVGLPTRFEIDGQRGRLPDSFRLSYDDFADVMRPFLAVPENVDVHDDCPASLFRPVVETLKRASRGASDLGLFVLHGGSSLNPLVREMLQENIGASGTLFRSVRFRQSPSPLGSVARGAALACFWEHARGHELVAPILAEPLGIIVSDGTQEGLLPAGTQLPFPDEHSVADRTGESDRFFVPSGGGGQVIVPYFAGHGPDGRGRHSGNIRISLPEGTRPGTPIRVRLRVDRNKLLHWWFSVGGSDWIEAESVADPWARRVPTYAERQLAEHRQRMRAAAEGGRLLSDVNLLIEEASRLRLAAQEEEALGVITDIFEFCGPSARAHNEKALCLEALEREEEELIEHEAAATLDPTDPILVGNLGCAYEDVGRLDEAVAKIRLALSMDRSLGYLYERLASIARRRGDEAMATRELKQAEAVYAARVEKEPFDRRSWSSLMQVRWSLGDYEGAEQALAVLEEFKHTDAFGGSIDEVVDGIKSVRR